MDDFERPKKAAFLEALRHTGNITKAAEVANCSRTNHYNWLKADTSGEYEMAYRDAIEHAVDELETEARRRAIEGDEEPIFDKTGREIGSRVRRSDVLLIFLLKGARPDKYRDTIVFDPKKLTDAEVDARLTQLIGKAAGPGTAPRTPTAPAGG